MKSTLAVSYSRFFKALSDPTRLYIVSLLAQGELCVCKIEAALSAPQAKVSRHLAYLRRHGIVKARRQWKWMYYSLVAPKSAQDEVLFSCLIRCVGGVTRRKYGRKKS